MLFTRISGGLVGTRLTGENGLANSVSSVNCSSHTMLLLATLLRIPSSSACCCSRSLRRWSSTLPDERPLAGIKVVDLTRVLAGPLATMMLVRDFSFPRVKLISRLIWEVSPAHSIRYEADALVQPMSSRYVIRSELDRADGQIESPLKGDDTRSWLPPFAPLSTNSTVPRPDLPPESAYFLQANRNKRS